MTLSNPGVQYRSNYFLSQLSFSLSLFLYPVQYEFSFFQSFLIRFNLIRNYPVNVFLVFSDLWLFSHVIYLSTKYVLYSLLLVAYMTLFEKLLITAEEYFPHCNYPRNVTYAYCYILLLFLKVSFLFLFTKRLTHFIMHGASSCTIL